MLATAGAWGLATPALARTSIHHEPAVERLRALQIRAIGRLGLYARDPATGRTLSFRADERFAMSSTFKAVLAGAILARVDAGQEQLDRPLPVTKADIVFHAPSTEKALEKGSMTVGELCEAIVVTSDNPAVNILMKTIGGPAGVTAYACGLGDTTFRLDRWEPELNSADPGDERDTTTPAAMAATLGKLVVGDALSAASRERLTRWMNLTRTGGNRLRRRLPLGWRAGDKTGWGSNGLTGDIAVFWRPDGSPIVVAAWIAESTAPIEVREAVLADVGGLVFETFGAAA